MDSQYFGDSMTNVEINALLRRHLGCYIGCYMSDTLPVRVRLRPAFLVVNTDPNSMPGDHWVAITLLSNDKAEYFCSGGAAPRVPAIKAFLNRNCHEWTYSRYELQSQHARTCGAFCCVYLYQRSQGMSYKKFLRQFGENKDLNEINMLRVLNELQ